jgi:hypothetical protein
MEMFGTRTMGRAATGLMAALVASLALTAQAGDTGQDKVPGNYGAMMKMKPMDVMHMMDPGKQGYVTRDQYMKFHEAMFDKMDKDKDGQVTEKEWSPDRSKDAGG